VRQEVFAAVARSIGAFRRDRPGDSFRGWLYAITRNVIRMRARRPDVRGTGGSDALRHLAAAPAAEPDPEPPADPAGECLVYARAVELIRGEFEPKTWEAFWRVTVDGRSAADVAADLGVSPNAVYLARSRVLRRLREEFQDLLTPGTGGGAPPAPEET
jgi:RNA polymerase sigma-70 factor (ECF subfamily)